MLKVCSRPNTRLLGGFRHRKMTGNGVNLPTRVAFLMQIKRPIRPRDRPLLDAYYRLLARPRRGVDTDDHTVDTVRDAVVLHEVPTPGKSHRRCASLAPPPRRRKSVSHHTRNVAVGIVVIVTVGLVRA